MTTDPNPATPAASPSFVVTTEVSFSDPQIVEHYKEFSEQVQAGRTNAVHAIGVHHAFAKVLLADATLTANEIATVKLKFRDMQARGGHVVAVPFAIANRLESERASFFNAIENRLKDEAAERERAA